MLDGHCHLLPPWLRPRGSAAWRDPWFTLCHDGPAARFASGADVVSALDDVGGQRAVVFGWPFTDPGLLREVNDYVAAEIAAHPQRLVGFAVVNPAQPGAAAELERCREVGLCGLGEVNADAQGFDLEWAGGLRRCLLQCRDLGWPALVHASEPVGHEYPGKGSATPDRLWRLVAPLLEEAEGLRLCLAHLGGGLPFYAWMPEVREVCRRLWFDTAALPFLYRGMVLDHLGDLVGRDRICFGSDFPLLTPRRYLPQLAGDDPWREAATAAWALG